MKILVMGACGQLGQAIARNSGFEKHSLTLVDKDILDITNRDAVREFICSGGFGAVINCAAFTNVDLCETEKELSARINLDGAVNAAEAAEETGAVFVQISTDFVFDGEKSSPYTETDPVSPLNYYGRIKAECEEAVRKTASRHYIVRTSSMYSADGANFARAVLRKAACDGELRVVDDQISSPTLSDELAAALCALLDTGAFGTYHITGGGYCSKYEFAGFITELCGIKASIEPCSSESFGSPARRPRFSALDNSKFLSLTGMKQLPWQETAEQFIRNNKNFYME